MARRYLLNAVEEAINSSPAWRLSRDLEEAVNGNLIKNGWSKNIGPARIGALARILAEEGRISRRPTNSYRVELMRRYEYKPRDQGIILGLGPIKVI